MCLADWPRPGLVDLPQRLSTQKSVCPGNYVPCLASAFLMPSGHTDILMTLEPVPSDVSNQWLLAVNLLSYLL